MEKEIVLVTGGNGFIGSFVSNKLVDLGYQVYVICRRPNSNNPEFNKNLENGSIKVFQGNIDSFDYSNMPKVDYIIHIAGLVSAYGKMEDFMKVNYLGTSRLLEFAKSIKSLKCFTYLSSTAVYGYNGYKGLKEDAEKKPFKNPYSISKLRTEKLVINYCKENKIDYIIARPGNVFGEYDYTSSYQIYKLVKHEKMTICAGGKYLSCFVYAGNLADAIIHTTLNKKCHNSDYNITDGENETLKEYLTMVAKSFNVRPKFINFPAPIAKMVASTVEGFYKLFHIRKAPLITKFSIWQNCADYNFSIEKLCNTGYRKAVTFKDAIDRTTKWFNLIENDKK